MLAVILALGAAAAVLALPRVSDLGTFTAALTLGIFASPILWQHYFVALLVALAATRRVRDQLCWALLLALWISPLRDPGDAGAGVADPMLPVGLALAAFRQAAAVT